MNCRHKQISELMLYALSSLICGVMIGCGVKGDPLPPKMAPELGRGEPSFRRATEGMKLPNLPPQEEEREESEDADEENI